MSVRILTGCFIGSFPKEIKVSDTNKYFCTENGILYYKDKSVLAFFPMGTDKTFFEIPEVEYISTYSFNTQIMSEYGSYVNIENLILHIPDCFLDGTTKSLESDEPLTEDKFIIALLGLTADKICIENENAFISYFGMTVEQWNEKTKTEQENALKEFNAYKNAYEKGEISKAEFVEYQEDYDDFVKTACYYEICNGKHNTIKDFTIDEVENTGVKFGETLTLTANPGETGLPEGCKVEWAVDGTGAEIQVSEDTLSCTIKSIGEGEIIVTARLVDANKNTVITDSGEDAVASQELTMDSETRLPGDLSGDGIVNTIDVSRTNAYARGLAKLNEFEFRCADINDDGKVNTIDVARINAHAKGITSLW